MLREIRKTGGLTLAAFGERIGVSKSTVHDWETGQVRLPLERAAMIEREFGAAGLVDEVVRSRTGLAA